MHSLIYTEEKRTERNILNSYHPVVLSNEIAAEKLKDFFISSQKSVAA
jgi:hypothetical protein